MAEVVQTYSTYLKNATARFLAAGAHVVLSSPTPNNPWESGSFTWEADRFTSYAWYVCVYPSARHSWTDKQEAD